MASEDIDDGGDGGGAGEAPHRFFDAACAAAWDKWFHVIEGGAQALSERMVALAGLEPGQRALDVATGLGEPAVTAARRVGPAGKVVAVDLSPDMLAYGARRAAELGLDNIEFREMDARALDVPEASFDAVLCRWGLMFIPDLDTALAGFRRALSPAGRFVATVWGAPEGAPALSLGGRVVRAHLGMPPPDEGPSTPFALADVEGLAARLEAAGFEDVAREGFVVDYVFDSVEAFTEFRQDRSAPLKREIAHHPEERQEAAWRALTEAARAYAGEDGEVRMANEGYLLSARR